MRSDDAVETIKRHAEYAVGTTHSRREESCTQYSTIGGLVRRQKNLMLHTQVR